MLIRVEYPDGVKREVQPHQLNRLLDYRLIERFKRADGWVNARHGDLRAPLGDTDYDGPERREVPFT